jgi:hypothetical protein
MDDPLLTLAQTLKATGDHAGAARALQRMADALRQAGDTATAALVLDHVSSEWWAAADVGAARGALEERLTLLRSLGDWHAVADTLVGLAFFPGGTDSGPAYLDETKRLVREHGFSDVEAQIRQQEYFFHAAGLDRDPGA